MRILLDESIPARLGSLLVGHLSVSVQRRGWAGVRNGRLLTLAGAEFDAFLTADRGIEHQQNLACLPIAVIVVLTRSNRFENLAHLVPAILEKLATLEPRSLVKIPA